MSHELILIMMPTDIRGKMVQNVPVFFIQVLHHACIRVGTTGVS